jgi:hypothetical protein
LELKHAKKTSQNWTKQHKIQTISPCIFSNNFQHTKLTRNKPKSINTNAKRTHQILQAFHQDFSTKRKSIKPRQNNFLVFLDQS